MTPHYVLLWELIFRLILCVQPTENTEDLDTVEECYGSDFDVEHSVAAIHYSNG